jgi:hypothetical protein
MHMTTDSLMTDLQKLGVRRVTLTFTDKGDPVVVANQVVNNKSDLGSEFTHAHSGQNFHDAAVKVQRDAEACAGLSSSIIKLNGGR